MEFKRSRLQKQTENDITKKTIFMGMLTVILFLIVIIFGIPLLVKFSVFLGETKIKNTKNEEKVVPPLAPRLSINTEATNSATMVISGYAENGAEVELFKNDVSYGKKTVGEDGKFDFQDVELSDGENSFNAVSKKNNVNSGLSKTYVIVYDNVAPEIQMSNPSEDNLKVDSADFDIKGKTEKGSSVTVNGRIALVDDSGNFKLKMQLSTGKNDIEIISKDLAGNEIKKKVTITYDF